MLRPLSRHVSRHALRASATAVAVGLLALGVPAAGQAAEAGPTLEFTHRMGDEPVEVEPYEEGVNGSVSVEVRHTGSQVLKNFTVALDATAFKGQMTLKASGPCVEKEPLLVVCDGEKLNGGKPLDPGGGLDVRDIHLRSLATARPGFTGDVRVFAESADGAPLGEMTFKAGVADLGPLIDRPGPSSTKTKPGATLRSRTGFTRFSSQPLKGVYIRMRLTQGLSYAEEFSNCEYGDYVGRGMWAHCYVETPIEPGGSYDLEELALKVGGTALREGWHLDVSRTGPDRLESPDLRRGTGRELKLVPRAGGPGEMTFGEAYHGVTVANAMDFEAVGATVDGKAGQVVKVKLGVRNNGPAVIEQWMGEPGDSPTSEIRVTVPPGTTAVKVPSKCSGEEPGPRDKPGGKLYSCLQDTDDVYFEAGQFTSFVFELRIDKPGDLAPGSVGVVSVIEEALGQKNNIAPITVTVDGKLGGGSGSSSGGSASGSGGSGSGGGSPSGGSGSAGSGSGSGSGDSGAPASGGAQEGAMADTGSGAVTWHVAAGGVALAAGAALVVAVRRRRAH